MKKVILAAIAVASMAGFAMAQSSDYNDLLTWLIAYNNNDKAAAYASLEGISADIKNQFPIDPALQAAVNAVSTKQQADIEALATRLGYTNFKKMYENQNDKAAQEEIKKIQAAYSNSPAVINMNAYYAELNTRYQAAAVEAIKRIKENAKAMNPNTPK
jgi:hypothetical protein